MIEQFGKPDNLRGLWQTLTALLPLAVLWWAVAISASISYWLTAGVVLLMSLFLVRVFVLMHECGHRSLFRSNRLNHAFGFLLGVVAGMPAHVWSQHHAHHHATNGDWEKYGGPLNIKTVDEYRAMSAKRQRRYRHARSVWLAPAGGFAYLLFMPRFNWLRGNVLFALHILRSLIARPLAPLHKHTEGFRSACWATRREYQHMLWNNAVLLCAWITMAWLIGPLLFAVCYVVSLSLAGGVGIALFTVQHNFEHSYASASKDWDYDAAVLSGTSFLMLPGWLNWFTANIGYHHIHHLSARIPNYRLAACHDAYAHLFDGVTRITLAQVPRALRCILWDTGARYIVPVAPRHADKNGA